MINLDRRFEIRMTADMEKLINELTVQTGRNRAEIFRRAIGLYKLARGVESRKGRFVIEEPDGTRRQFTGI